MGEYALKIGSPEAALLLGAAQTCADLPPMRRYGERSGRDLRFAIGAQQEGRLGAGRRRDGGILDLSVRRGSGGGEP